MRTLKISSRVDKMVTPSVYFNCGRKEIKMKSIIKNSMGGQINLSLLQAGSSTNRPDFKDRNLNSCGLFLSTLGVFSKVLTYCGSIAPLTSRTHRKAKKEQEFPNTAPNVTVDKRSKKGRWVLGRLGCPMFGAQHARTINRPSFSLI